MSDVRDRTHCIKNLIRVMCCDGRITGREKKFLLRAAEQLQVEVENWNTLVREVLRDPQILFPVQNRDRAIASLRAVIVMARADGRLDAKERDLILQFAKSLGLSNPEWKRILKEIDIQTLFEPFQSTALSPDVESIFVLKEDFDKIDAFLEVVREYKIPFEIGRFDDFLKDSKPPEAVVCFHAAEDRQTTVDKCRSLLNRCGGRLVAILARHQGYQVRYLLEIGLNKCIIEPVYARDIEKLFEGV